MKKFATLCVAASFAFAAAPQAMAKGKEMHHGYGHECAAPAAPIGELAVLGLALGAVTGGVGSAVAYGAAYAVGGAAIGGGSGLLLGAIHDHHHCH